MDGPGEQSHLVKRVVLPSGKTIEVVYSRQADSARFERGRPRAEAQQDLHVCIECSCEFVYPVQWEETGPVNWTVLLHCPNCQLYREGVFAQDTVEAFDEELDRGASMLERDYARLVHANMSQEIDLFVAALAADAILPEDF